MESGHRAVKLSGPAWRVNRRARGTAWRLPSPATPQPCSAAALRRPQPDLLPAFVTRLNARRPASRSSASRNYFILAWQVAPLHLRAPVLRQDVVQQMDAIGVQSLGIVLLTGFFTGMVLALQSSVQLRTFGATHVHRQPRRRRR